MLDWGLGTRTRRSSRPSFQLPTYQQMPGEHQSAMSLPCFARGVSLNEVDVFQAKSSRCGPRSPSPVRPQSRLYTCREPRPHTRAHAEKRTHSLLGSQKIKIRSSQGIGRRSMGIVGLGIDHHTLCHGSTLHHLSAVPRVMPRLVPRIAYASL